MHTNARYTISFTAKNSKHRLIHLMAFDNQILILLLIDMASVLWHNLLKLSGKKSSFFFIWRGRAVSSFNDFCCAIFRLICNEDWSLAPLAKIANGSTRAIMVTDINVHDFFNYEHDPYRHLKFTSEKLVRLSAIFYYAKESILIRRRFDRRMRYLEANGIINRYQRMFRGIKRNSKKKLKKLKITRVSPIFRICGILCAIAVLVFLLEIYAYRFRMIKYIIEYLTY